MSNAGIGFLMFLVFAVIVVTNRPRTDGAKRAQDPEKAKPVQLKTGERAQFLLTETGVRYRVSELEDDRTLVEKVNNRGKRLSAEAVDENIDEVIDQILQIKTPHDFVPQKRVMARRVQRKFPRKPGQLALPAPTAINS